MITPEQQQPQKSNDPLHGTTLKMILDYLLTYYDGWEQLAVNIPINCFMNKPSMNSSLKFLRKTDWARKKVENLYLDVKFEREQDGKF